MDIIQLTFTGAVLLIGGGLILALLLLKLLLYLALIYLLLYPVYWLRMHYKPVEKQKRETSALI